MNHWKIDERFKFSYKRAHNCTLDEETLKLVLLRGVREELMETPNILANGEWRP